MVTYVRHFGRRLIVTRFSQAALKRSILAATLLLVWAGRDDGLPDAIGRQLPAGYVVLETVRGRLTGGVRDDYVVALARPGDVPDNPVGSGPGDGAAAAGIRALRDGSYALAGRNDALVMRHDQGGQCDPFDPEQGLVMKGVFVTVQNEVACGAHWSDYITFRYDRARGALLFDSDIVHSLKFNPSDAPDADIIVPDGPPVVTRADPHHPVAFSAWKPPR